MTHKDAERFQKKEWTAQEDTILRQLVVEKDLPYAKAAEILGRGRAACISRGRRLGIKKGRRITRPGCTLKPQKHPWRNVRLPDQNSHPRFGPDSPPPSPSGFSQEPTESRPPHRPLKANAPAPKRLIDLEPSECRWPVGEAPREDGITGFETVFCADICEDGKPYCSHHCGVAYVSRSTCEGE